MGEVLINQRSWGPTPTRSRVARSPAARAAGAAHTTVPEE